MLDEETYKKELVRMWDMQRGYDYEGKDICDGVLCEDCPLSEINNDERDGCMDVKNVFEIIKIVEMWSKENPPKKYKVSKLEYDIMCATIKYSSNDDSFYDVDILFDLIQKGYFKGACGNMFIHYYFDRCEVSDNDG